VVPVARPGKRILTRATMQTTVFNIQVHDRCTDYLVTNSFGQIIGRAYDTADGGFIGEHTLSGATRRLGRLEAAEAWVRMTNLTVSPRS
jgi:hypothetical protein